MTLARYSLAASLVATIVGAAAVGVVGCRGDFVGVTPGSPSDDDDDTSSSGTGGSTSSSGTGDLTCPNLAEGRPVGCEGLDAEIGELTTGAIGLDQMVTITDVVAMSQKFLVSGPGNSGNCLYGVYVSSQVAETGADTGMLVIGRGSGAFIPLGETEAACPKLGQEPACDGIPDDVKPGDLLTITGINQIFPNPPTNCTGDDPDNQVGMRQLADICYVERNGTAPVPATHVLTPDEIAKIPSTTDAAFHGSWGGVKVRLENVGVDPESNNVVGAFGIITLDNGIAVGGKLYYRPYSDNPCHASASFEDTDVVWSSIEGFHYLNFCSWGIDVNDKCHDFVPASEDCQTQTCAFDVMPPTP